MNKSSFFNGQPVFTQLSSLLNRDKILKISKNNGSERYVKSFDAYSHLITMLYGVIKRFDSLREIETSMKFDARKLAHLGILRLPRRSTLADANARRSEKIFQQVYFDLERKHRKEFLSDSRTIPAWMSRLRIIDSTTISLFSNVLFKGVGRNPKTGKKKGGIKVHTVLQANTGVPSDIRFTSAATHDHFLLVPEMLDTNDFITMDRAYIDYEKFEAISNRGAWYVTKMKKNLNYKTLKSTMFMGGDGTLKYHVQDVEFEQPHKGLTHTSRIVTYTNLKGKKAKSVSLLTNNFELPAEEIVQIYDARWQIESLFKQIKQNFPLHFFYGESENAIKIQIWTTLIANLLLTLVKQRLKCKWSFSGLATIFRIILMQYVDYKSFLENPNLEWEFVQQRTKMPPPKTIKN